MKHLTAVATFALSFFFASAFAASSESEFAYPEGADYPPQKKLGKRVEDFIPKRWTVLSKAVGDLNGDKVDDAAIVVKGNLAKFKQRNKGFGVEVLDTNPRLLLVLFKDARTGTYKLAEDNTVLVDRGINPTQEEPFKKIQIRDGVLDVFLTSFANAGSWYASETTYRFQYRGNQFVLIGADRHEWQRNTGEEANYSVNFVTRRLHCVSSNPYQKTKPKSEWVKFKPGRLKTMSSFSALDEWEGAPGFTL